MNDATKESLADTIVMGLPGAADGWTLDGLREQIAVYAGIDSDSLHGNLINVLSDMAPEAQGLACVFAVIPTIRRSRSSACPAKCRAKPTTHG